MLTQQVEQCRFDGGDDVDRGPQVEGLQSAAGDVPVGEGGANPVEDGAVGGDTGADDQRLALA